MVRNPVLQILRHALGVDQKNYRNHFCAGEGHADFATCREAVAQGLLREYPPTAISGGDSIFLVTDAGKAYIAANPLPVPKWTRGQRRYREWLAADSGIGFGEWLRGRKGGVSGGVP